MKLLLVFLALVSAVLCAPSTPRKDPFYEPPHGWEKKEPGTILKSRTIQPGVFQYLKYDMTAYQLLYRTTALDEPSHTVTTVLVPQHAEKDKLVLVAPYVDADGPECAPSYTVQAGSQLKVDLIGSIQTLLWTALLNEGWIVTVPDHLGPMNAFAAGRLEAHMLLDGARATLQYSKLGLHEHTKVVGYGYSGGGISGGWAASLQQKYAPNLNIVGWVLGGMPANIHKLITNLEGGTYAGFIVSGLGGLMNAYQDLRHAIEPRLTHLGHSAVRYVNEHCAPSISTKFLKEKILSKKYVHNGKEILKTEPLKSILDTLTVGKHEDETPNVPVSYFHAMHDDVIPFGPSADVVERWAKNGARVKFIKFTADYLNHAGVGVLHMPYAVQEVRARFRGETIAKGVTEKRVKDLFHLPNYLTHELEEIWGVLRSLFTREVGPRDTLFLERMESSKRYSDSG